MRKSSSVKLLAFLKGYNGLLVAGLINSGRPVIVQRNVDHGVYNSTLRHLTPIDDSYSSYDR